MFKFSKIIPLFCATLFIALFTTACNPEDIDPQVDPQTEDATNNGNRFLESVNRRVESTSNSSDTTELLCFTINYPITILFPDGSSQAVNNDDELEAVTETWYNNNPESEDDPTLIFPIQVTLEDGSSQTINGEEDLCELFHNCFGDEDWGDEGWEEGEDDDCFTINYPISVTSEAGTTVINDDEAFEAFLEGLGEDEDFEFVFPIDVTVVEDSTTQTLNSDDDLDDLLDDCYADWGDEGWEDEIEDFDCFTLVYPLSVITDAGTVALNNEDEFFNFLEGLGEEEDFEFSYPLNVIASADSSLQVINNEEEFEDLFADCFDEWEEEEACFDFAYPFQVTTSAGTTTINNDEEFEAFCEGLTEDEDFQFVFPLDIILEDGSQETINNEEGLYAAGESCLD